MLRGQIMGQKKRGSEEPYMCVCRGFNALFFFRPLFPFDPVPPNSIKHCTIKKKIAPLLPFFGMRRNMFLQKHSFVVIDCYASLILKSFIKIIIIFPTF
jgi:hypothetical protein